jgi:hypothetical protein
MALAREGSMKRFELAEEPHKELEMLSLDDDVTWSLAEQVSHHPPVTAYLNARKREGSEREEREG